VSSPRLVTVYRRQGQHSPYLSVLDSCQPSRPDSPVARRRPGDQHQPRRPRKPAARADSSTAGARGRRRLAPIEGRVGVTRAYTCLRHPYLRPEHAAWPRHIVGGGGRRDATLHRDRVLRDNTKQPQTGIGDQQCSQGCDLLGTTNLAAECSAEASTSAIRLHHRPMF